METGGVWRCILEKAYIAVNGHYIAVNEPLRAVVVRAQEEKRRAID